MHFEILRFCGTSSGEYLFESLNPFTRIYHSDSRGGPCCTRKELLSVIAWALRRHWFYPSGETLASDGRTWKDNDASEGGDGKESIYILQGCSKQQMLVSCIHLSTWSSSSHVARAFEREAPREIETTVGKVLRFSRDLFIYYDSVRDILEIFFFRYEIHAKNSFSLSIIGSLKLES